MLSAAEYLLKAENCAFAAQMADTLDQRERFIRASAILRNKALRVKLGEKAEVLRRCPFTKDQLWRC